MYRSQALAIKYFSAAMILFGVMTLFGLVSAYYYLNPDFLFGILPFNIAKIMHINTLVIWLLMGSWGRSTGFCRKNWVERPPVFGRPRYCSTCFAPRLRWSRWCSSLSNMAAATRRLCGLSIRAESMSRRRVGRPGGFRLQRDRNRDRRSQDHRNHHRFDDRPDTADLALSDRLSGHQQHVGRSVLVVVARPSLGRGHLGGSDRLHHGLGPDAAAWYLAKDCRDVALYRGGSRPRHRDP